MRLNRFLGIFMILAVTSCATANIDNDNKVKNVIYIIGDGMGLAQISLNEADTNAFELYTNTAVVRTESANNRVTDSAAGATALFTGHKTNNSFVGVTPDSSSVTNLAERCRDNGLASGIVTLCAVTHATPAGFYAHSTSRHDDGEIILDLAKSGLDIVICGGSKFVDPKICGSDSVLNNLKGNGYKVVLNDTSYIRSVAPGDESLILLPYEYHYPSFEERGSNNLVNGTKAALSFLSERSEKGFMLMVEESQIDWVCHANNPDGLKKEMSEINGAMLAAKDFADKNPGTLVVVVADHETGGLTIPSNDSDFCKEESGISYKWSTSSHTSSPVVLFAYGTGAENFSGLMDNTEVHDTICRLLGL